MRQLPYAKLNFPKLVAVVRMDARSWWKRGSGESPVTSSTHSGLSSPHLLSKDGGNSTYLVGLWQRKNVYKARVVTFGN